MNGFRVNVFPWEALIPKYHFQFPYSEDSIYSFLKGPPQFHIMSCDQESLCLGIFKGFPMEYVATSRVLGIKIHLKQAYPLTMHGFKVYG